MLFLLFVQSLFQFGAKVLKWEGYYGEKNYLDMSFLWNKVVSQKVGLFDLEIGLALKKSAGTNMGPQNNTYLSAPDCWKKVLGCLRS